MKIWILSKRKLYFYFLPIFFSVFLFSFFSYSTSILVSSNSYTNFLNKVNTLTSKNEKIAYLTFDDGPNPAVTPKVLDILKEENVKATFFVIGKSVETYPDIVKRAYQEGHYIANHGYSHNNSILYKNFVSEITKTDEAISKAIDKKNYCAHVFRFPNGFMSPIYKKEKKEAILQLAKIDYTYIDWNCLNNDSVKKYTPNELLENLKKSCKNKNTLVILMHDTKDVSNSSLALQDSILYLKSQGYTFQNFYDLIP
ncbi:MAG: polysaccharide deacetylase [Clostridia bacterium]|nr:polysaccharide deacetylase [Clostridia bacterium]